MFKFSKLFVVLAMLAFASLAFGAEYSVDEAHSNVGFRVKHMVIAKVNGNFSDYKIDLMFDAANLAKSKVDVVVQVKSVDTDNAKRDAHLVSPDFFDAETYPTIEFHGKKFSKTGENMYSVNGDLTIRGVTKNVDLPFTVLGELVDPWGNTRMGLEAGMSINRQDFGVSWNKTLDNGGFVVSDEVKITIDAEFLKK